MSRSKSALSYEIMMLTDAFLHYLALLNVAFCATGNQARSPPPHVIVDASYCEPLHISFRFLSSFWCKRLFVPSAFGKLFLTHSFPHNVVLYSL